MKHNTVLTVLVLVFLSITCRSERVDFAGEEGYVAGAEGARLYYRVLGTGRDSIVVLHGGPGAGMNSILSSVLPLTERHVLIFYDQRGGGRSELPDDTSKLQARYFIEDLEMIRRHFRLNRMNVIAHSFGSILLAKYAKDHPDRLRRVLFHGATGPRRPEAGRYYAAKAAIPPADTALAVKASSLLKLLLSGEAADPALTCQEYERIGRQLAMMRGESANYSGTTCDAAEAIRYYYRYTAQIAPRTFGWDFTTGLKDVKAPLLVIYGVNDSLGIPMQRAWITVFQNIRLLLIPKAGKTAFSDNPDFVFPALERFFDGHWPEQAEPPGQKTG